MSGQNIDVKDHFSATFSEGHLYLGVDLFGLAKTIAKKTNNEIDDTAVAVAIGLLKDVTFSTKGLKSSL